MEKKKKINEIYMLTHVGTTSDEINAAEDIVKIVKANKNAVLIVTPQFGEGKITNLVKSNIPKDRHYIVPTDLAHKTSGETSGTHSEEMISLFKLKFKNRIDKNARILSTGSSLYACVAAQGKNVSKAFKIPLKNIYPLPRYSSPDLPFMDKTKREWSLPYIKASYKQKGIKWQPVPSLKHRKRAKLRKR